MSADRVILAQLTCTGMASSRMNLARGQFAGFFAPALECMIPPGVLEAQAPTSNTSDAWPLFDAFYVAPLNRKERLEAVMLSAVAGASQVMKYGCIPTDYGWLELLLSVLCEAGECESANF